jgi:hypothetical protein
MLHNICTDKFSRLNFLFMPGNDDTFETRSDKPEANKASKQQAHVDHDEDMGEVDPKYKNKADKALRKDVDSNKDPDATKTNSFSGNRRDE